MDVIVPFNLPIQELHMRAWGLTNHYGVTVTTRLILIRHGESTSNVLGIATSRLDGYPLTDTGRAQASAAAEELAAAGATHIYASPILRARQTAQIVAERISLPLSIVPGLEEIDVGTQEGDTGDAAMMQGASNFQRWLTLDELDHGFEGGETGRTAGDRMAGTLNALVHAHGSGTAIVVSHGGVLALALLQLCDNLSGSFVHEHLLGNCAQVDVVIKSERWHCAAWAGSRPAATDADAVA
jgi:broad specificity phosphatase PhoE